MATVGKSKMLLVLVISVIAAFVEAGYQVNTPSIPLALPNNRLVQQINTLGNVQPDVTLTTIHQPEHSVSYAISHEDYEYLKQQKNQGQPHISSHHNDYHGDIKIINDALIADSPLNFNSGHGYPTLQANKAPHHGNIVTNQGHIGTYQENLELTNQGHIGTNQGTIGTYQQNIGTNQVRIETNQGNIGKYQSNVPIVNPVVKKHVYFHVPPPDIEEPQPVVQVPPPKKVYKIIFIKVPTQETPLNIASLQQALQSQLPPIQDKTLIYFLSKKEEPPQVVVPKPTISDHEVFFVKYNGNANNIAQINNELIRSESQNGLPILQPGLLNGQP